MDPRYKKFLTLVELGSFSAAAKKLHVSQPAITIAMASLERSLGKRLIIRKRHLVELTTSGKIVLESARRINQEIEQMQKNLENNATLPVAHVGFIDSIAHLLYTSPKSQPVLSNIEVMVDSSVKIINDLKNCQIDFGFITGQALPLDTDIVTYKLHDEPFVFVTSPANHPKHMVNEISDWLAFNQDSTTYKHFKKLFSRQNIQVTPTFYSTSMELLKEMAIAGNGTALLPEHFVKSAVQNNLLVVVETQPMSRPIWIISRKNDNKPNLFEPLASKINELLVKNNTRVL